MTKGPYSLGFPGERIDHATKTTFIPTNDHGVEIVWDPINDFAVVFEHILGCRLYDGDGEYRCDSLLQVMAVVYNIVDTHRGNNDRT